MSPKRRQVGGVVAGGIRVQDAGCSLVGVSESGPCGGCVGSLFLGLIQGAVWCPVPCQVGVPLKKAVTSEGFVLF